MPIDSRFSKDQFEAEGRRGQSTRQLCDQLQGEVLALLQDGLCRAVREIVGQLNEQGHSLRLYYPPEPGDISFRDDHAENGAYQCDLRLGVDVVVSAGFRDTVKGESSVS